MANKKRYVSLAFLVAGIFASLSIPAHAEPFETIISNGNSADRIDIAILGDGYTAEQMALYATHVQTFIQGVFLQEPYREYQRYYNVHRIDVVSSQSGADHPERVPPVFVDTALDATYNCGNIQRLICINTSKVNQVIARTLSASQFDVILVLVNDPEYGGSGGSVAVASIHPSGTELILHEVGHSFGLLADEYAGGGPSCNPNLEPPEVNATRETARNLIKWRHWIDDATPIPTSPGPAGLPGLYVGSKYCDTGLYRPTNNNKMRSLGFPFEQINSEQHVKRFYTFSSPIDSSLPSAIVLSFPANQQQAFSVATPLPFTHSLSIRWSVNGLEVGNLASYTLPANSLSPGTHQVQVEVKDETPFVRNDPNNLLKETRGWTLNVEPASSIRAPFDFDGDAKTDVAIFRPVGGGGSSEWWWVNSGNGSNSALQFGTASDVIAPGDFTGDGKMDITIFRPSNGNWFVLRSDDFSFFSFPFGSAGDTPATGDYDGDGKADPAVFRASVGQWFIQRSSDNQTQILGFGIPGDVPVTADYDGDGKDDIGIYRRGGANGGEWWINRSTAGLIALNFGTSTDLTVPGDYTGDGKADIAIFRPSNGTWFVLRSEDLSFFSFPFGAAGDVPSPGDYDGDGKIDAAVFRPSSATWFIQGSTSGTTIQQFGSTGDVPVPSSFVR